jgi:tetrahydromethanopterin S-methyltransferase subunit F
MMIMDARRGQNKNRTARVEDLKERNEWIKRNKQ